MKSDRETVSVELPALAVSAPQRLGSACLIGSSGGSYVGLRMIKIGK